MSSTPETTPPAAPAEAASETNPWNDRIAAFAGAVKKPASAITDALTPLVGEANTEGLAAISELTNDDLLKVLVNEGPKVPLALFRKHLSVLRGPAAMATTSASGASISPVSILPPLPDEASFLELLKTGGVLKPGVAGVLSAIRVGIAKSTGLFELPTTIVKKMEDHAVALEEPVGEDFYNMQALLTEKKYSELFAALGVTRHAVTDVRKRAFLDRLDDNMWNSLWNFQVQLRGFQESWMQGALTGPAAIQGIMAMMGARNTGGILPANMSALPETSAIRASAEEVINTINRIFAGTGVPAAHALAHDAKRILDALNDPKLPLQLGAANKDQMLKDLGIKVGAEIVRMEQSLSRYALGIMSLPKVTGDEELLYLNALFQLGVSIPWNQLGVEGQAGGRAGLGRPARNGGRGGYGSLDNEEVSLGGRRRE